MFSSCWASELALHLDPSLSSIFSSSSAGSNVALSCSLWGPQSAEMVYNLPCVCLSVHWSPFRLNWKKLINGPRQEVGRSFFFKCAFRPQGTLEVSPYFPLWGGKFWEQWCAILLTSHALPRTELRRPTCVLQPGNSMLSPPCRNFPPFWGTLSEPLSLGFHKANPLQFFKYLCCIELSKIERICPQRSVVLTSDLILKCGAFFWLLVFNLNCCTIQRVPVQHSVIQVSLNHTLKETLITYFPKITTLVYFSIVVVQ